MKFVSINGLNYSEDMIDPLHRYIPNMNSFRYAIPTNNYNRSLRRSSFNLSKFARLQSFVIDFDCYWNSGFEYLIFQIKRRGDKKMIYYYVEEDYKLKSTD